MFYFINTLRENLLHKFEVPLHIASLYASLVISINDLALHSLNIELPFLVYIDKF